jgi:uncharacterized repeat protein (TIGR01451 family)
MQHMKKLIYLFLLLVASYWLVNPVSAQYGQYGSETPSYSILIDKMVGKPSQEKGGSQTVTYVDNLSPSDPRFSPNQQVWFKIKVKNTSNQNLTAIQVTDYVPSYLMPIEGPGKWNPDNRTISWNAGDFAVDEEKVYYIKMQVFDQSLLPSDKGLFCVVNKVEAKKDNVAYDDDTAQLCIEKQVSGVKTVPKAGPEMGLVILGLNFLTTALGLSIKKLADKN